MKPFKTYCSKCGGSTLLEGPELLDLIGYEEHVKEFKEEIARLKLVHERGERLYKQNQEHLMAQIRILKQDSNE